MAGPIRVERTSVHGAPDLAGLAAEAELRYSTDAEPGISRRRVGKGFQFGEAHLAGTLPRGRSRRVEPGEQATHSISRREEFALVRFLEQRMSLDDRK
jgi:hypothetical protein